MADDNIIGMADRAWTESKSHFEVLPATRFKPEPIRWLWPQWLARGKLQLLAGSPGTGKTTIAVALAAAVTTGAAWPDGGHADLGDVLFWSGEDGIADTLVPRFLAAGGDLNRLHFAGDVTDGRRSRAFDPAEDLPRLIAAVRDMRDLKLMVLDPVVSTVTGDSHKNTETRRALQPIVDMATKLDMAVIGITHLSKGTSGRDPLERVAGSIAFGAVARVVLATVKARDPKHPHRLVRAKSNLGLDHGGIEYNLLAAPVPDFDFPAQRVEWGQGLEGSAHDLMSIEQDEEENAISEAGAFLKDLLAEGPTPTREVRAAIMANGHKWRTVERAKSDLGVKATKGVGGGWYWSLGDEPLPGGDQHRRLIERGGVAANPASPLDNPASHDGGGGVVDEERAYRRDRLEFEIGELENDIRRKKEQIGILTSYERPTTDQKLELFQMERKLKGLRQLLAQT
jgi:putative DNA primase/helicase